MKIKTNELTGAALDWAVAKCEGVPVYVSAHGSLDRRDVEPTALNGWAKYSPSTDWPQGGPILEMEKIATVYRAGGYWLAYTHENYPGRAAEGIGPTPLIAAMRCYAASKLGDEVDVPEELL